MIRRSLIALALALAACSQPAAKAPAPKNEVVFSLLSAESQTSAEKDFKPFIDDMSKALGMPVKAFYASNYTALIEAMRFKQVDLGWYTNQSALDAVRRSDGGGISRRADPSGIDG